MSSWHSAVKRGVQCAPEAVQLTGSRGRGNAQVMPVRPYSVLLRNNRMLPNLAALCVDDIQTRICASTSWHRLRNRQNHQLELGSGWVALLDGTICRYRFQQRP